MEINIDNLKKFIDKIKTIGFFERIFGWRKIKQLLYDAIQDFEKLNTTADNLYKTNLDIKTKLSNVEKDFDIAKESIIKKESEISKLDSVLIENNEKLSRLNSELSSSTTTVKSQEEKINQHASDIRVLKETNGTLTYENNKMKEDAATNSESLTNITRRKNELDVEIGKIQTENKSLKLELDAIKKLNTQLAKDEEFRKQEHSNSIASLNKFQEQIQKDRNDEIEKKNKIEIDRLKGLKDTWSKHQENVKNIIKNLSTKYTIEYIDKVPFKGEPDNTLRICDEYIIFDAKSPGGDNLANFPNYLKDQAERAKKYIKEDSVKKDIFFVVPSNTLEIMRYFVYRLADYNVFIISLDSLEPVLLSLKKIEEYEFAEQLSPEDRENICRVLGKFAHLSKRRIQIDSFFIKQFMELAYKCESDLPEDILEKVIEFEKAEKLNPPTEKRAKQIIIKELEKDSTKIRSDADTKGIVMQDDALSAEINKLPLYKEEENNKK